MKFSLFRQEMEKPVPDPSLPSKMVGTRKVFRDWDSSPWDLEWLDDKMCPDCAGDLSIKLTDSDNVVFYDCDSSKDHRFVRIFHRPKPSTTSATLAKAREVL